MPTPKTVLMTHRDDRDVHGELQRVDDVGVVEEVLRGRSRPSAKVFWPTSVHRPRHQQEQVGDDDEPDAAT